MQLDSRLARQYAGTGLGLALVPRMAELHGGSVTVESEAGVGSRFTVALPWRDEAPAQPIARPVLRPHVGLPRAGRRRCPQLICWPTTTSPTCSLQHNYLEAAATAWSWRATAPRPWSARDARRPR